MISNRQCANGVPDSGPEWPLLWLARNVCDGLHRIGSETFNFSSFPKVVRNPHCLANLSPYRLAFP